MDVDLDKLEATFDIALPREYRSYMVQNGPGPLVDEETAYVELWPPDLIRRVNGDLDVSAAWPFLFYFGGDGSREMLAFDTRTEPPRVVLCDITNPSLASLFEQGSSFADFVRQLQQRGSLYFREGK